MVMSHQQRPIIFTSAQHVARQSIDATCAKLFGIKGRLTSRLRWTHSRFSDRPRFQREYGGALALSHFGTRMLAPVLH